MLKTKKAVGTCLCVNCFFVWIFIRSGHLGLFWASAPCWWFFRQVESVSNKGKALPRSPLLSNSPCRGERLGWRTHYSHSCCHTCPNDRLLQQPKSLLATKMVVIPIQTKGFCNGKLKIISDKSIVIPIQTTGFYNTSFVGYIRESVVIPIQTMGFYNTGTFLTVLLLVVILIQTTGFYNNQSNDLKKLAGCHTHPNDGLLQLVR